MEGSFFPFHILSDYEDADGGVNFLILTRMKNRTVPYPSISISIRAYNGCYQGHGQTRRSTSIQVVNLDDESRNKIMD
jgi:hypothetical protein